MVTRVDKSKVGHLAVLYCTHQQQHKNKLDYSNPSHNYIASSLRDFGQEAIHQLLVGAVNGMLLGAILQAACSTGNSDGLEKP